MIGRLIVIGDRQLVAGFHLVGVEAHWADNPKAADKALNDILDSNASGLVAIQERLFADIAPATFRRLRSSTSLLHLAIPDGRPTDVELSPQERIATLLQEAVGFQITFLSEQSELSSS